MVILVISFGGFLGGRGGGGGALGGGGGRGGGGGGGGGAIIVSDDPCRGMWGYLPRENFQIWRLRNSIFSTCHEICLRKIDLEYQNGK